MPSHLKRRSRPERTPQTCPNEGCEKRGERTNLMGGCAACGAQMVDWTPSEPTNEQLENFCTVLGIPVWPGWFDRNEQMRQGALKLHRMFGEAAAGDPKTQRDLEAWMDMFGRLTNAA